MVFPELSSSFISSGMYSVEILKQNIIKGGKAVEAHFQTRHQPSEHLVGILLIVAIFLLMCKTKQYIILLRTAMKSDQIFK